MLPVIYIYFPLLYIVLINNIDLHTVCHDYHKYMYSFVEPL